MSWTDMFFSFLFPHKENIDSTIEMLKGSMHKISEQLRILKKVGKDGDKIEILSTLIASVSEFPHIQFSSLEQSVLWLYRRKFITLHDDFKSVLQRLSERAEEQLQGAELDSLFDDVAAFMRLQETFETLVRHYQRSRRFVEFSFKSLYLVPLILTYFLGVYFRWGEGMTHQETQIVWSNNVYEAPAKDQDPVILSSFIPSKGHRSNFILSEDYRSTFWDEFSLFYFQQENNFKELFSIRRFTLTAQDFEKLKLHGFPEETLEALRPIKDQSFMLEKDFWGAVTRHVAVDDQNKRLILQYAEHVTVMLKVVFKNTSRSKPFFISTIDAAVEYAPPTFKLTQYAFEQLQKEGLPDTIVDDLQGLKDKEFITDSAFDTALKTRMDEEQFTQYKEPLLKYAKQSNPRVFPGEHLSVEPKIHFERQGESVSFQNTGIGPAINFSYEIATPDKLPIFHELLATPFFSKDDMRNLEVIPGVMEVEYRFDRVSSEGTVGIAEVKDDQLRPPFFWRLEQSEYESEKQVEMCETPEDWEGKTHCYTLQGWVEKIETIDTLCEKVPCHKEVILRYHYSSLRGEFYQPDEKLVELPKTLVFYLKSDNLQRADTHTPTIGRGAWDRLDGTVTPIEKIATAFFPKLTEGPTPEGKDIITSNITLDVQNLTNDFPQTRVHNEDSFLNPQGNLIVYLSLEFPKNAVYTVKVRLNGEDEGMSQHTVQLETLMPEEYSPFDPTQYESEMLPKLGILEDSIQWHQSMGEWYLAHRLYDKSKTEWEKVLENQAVNKLVKQRLHEQANLRLKDIEQEPSALELKPVSILVPSVAESPIVSNDIEQEPSALELKPVVVVPIQPITKDIIVVSCEYSVTLNDPINRTISRGDILAPADPSLAPVVAAEDLFPSNKQSNPSLKVFFTQKLGQPTPDSEYVRIISHSNQLEQAIRVGQSESYHPCDIQNVIYSLTIPSGSPPTLANLSVAPNSVSLGSTTKLTVQYMDANFDEQSTADALAVISIDGNEVARVPFQPQSKHEVLTIPLEITGQQQDADRQLTLRILDSEGNWSNSVTKPLTFVDYRDGSTHNGHAHGFESSPINPGDMGHAHGFETFPINSGK